MGVLMVVERVAPVGKQVARKTLVAEVASGESALSTAASWLVASGDPHGLSQGLTRSQTQFMDAVVRELSTRDPSGVLLDRVQDADLLATQMVDLVLGSAAVWADLLGPMYDVDGVAWLLAINGKPISRQAVSKRRNLLALTTGSGRVVYPAFQFDNGHLIDGLGDVLALLPTQIVSRWAVASWLMSHDRALGGDTPMSVLRQGGRGPVVDVARQWAHALST